MLRSKDREPDFNNLKLILEKKPAPRPVLFDFIIGDEKAKMLIHEDYKNDTELNRIISNIKAFDSAGYDFAPILIRGLEFTRNEANVENMQTKSLNSGAIITDRESFNNYVWPEISNCDFSIIKKVSPYLHPKAKFIPFSFDGILENTIGVVGYENLCLLLYDDPGLVEDVFYQIGSRLYQYYEAIIDYDEVGAIICNDDWGFNSQTMLPPTLMRKFIFPWYQKIVALAHEKGKYAILHSCGYFESIMDDIVHVMKFDARHSYEDKIMPVEKAYDMFYPSIAVLGGIDINFLARKTPEEIYQRCKNILLKTRNTGGYAIGSGNSIPDYISNENALSLFKAALEAYDEGAHYVKE